MDFIIELGIKDSLHREDLEASFAHFLPSHHDYAVDQVI